MTVGWQYGPFQNEFGARFYSSGQIQIQFFDKYNHNNFKLHIYMAFLLTSDFMQL